MLRPPTRFEKYVRHPLEGALAVVLWTLLRILPLDAASALGGWVGRTVGPRLPGSERARRNIRRAFPEFSDAEVEKTVRDMWDNLGRTAAEFPHISRLDLTAPDSRVKIKGSEHLLAMHESDEPGLVFGAHLGNWELGPMTASALGVPMTIVYRQANNPLVEALYHAGRRRRVGDYIPKGSEGARELIRVLSGKGLVGMLVDQKMNDGIAVPFFGHDAMTAPALAQMGLRYGCPVAGHRIVRDKGAYFRFIFEPAVRVPDSGAREEDIRRFMAEINKTLESWIREHPGQWLWLHNRWPNGDS